MCDSLFLYEAFGIGDGSVMGKKIIVFLIYTLMGAAFIVRLYPFAILPDEFGYWQNVALVRGIDWSEVNALGDYYSFGYEELYTNI